MPVPGGARQLPGRRRIPAAAERHHPSCFHLEQLLAAGVPPSRAWRHCATRAPSRLQRRSSTLITTARRRGAGHCRAPRRCQPEAGLPVAVSLLCGEQAGCSAGTICDIGGTRRKKSSPATHAASRFICPSSPRCCCSPSSSPSSTSSPSSERLRLFRSAPALADPHPRAPGRLWAAALPQCAALGAHVRRSKRCAARSPRLPPVGRILL